jgi:DNA-binding CsgD family transcriptional regulator
MNEAADYNLTARELEVLGLMAAGQTTKELAYNLGISFKTAACHRNRILGKFGAHNTAEVISRAIATGLITV